MTQQDRRHGGHDTDGEASEGILDEKTLETDATLLGLEEDEDEEEDEASPGMVQPQASHEREEARAEDLER